MIRSQKIANPDFIGAVASVLCLIHCIATPFLFIAKACSVTCCSAAPFWWQAIDYLFLVISFVAIYYATKNASKKWVRIVLWSSWTLLLFTILNETLKTGLLPKSFVYFPALLIVVFHFYNLKYCKSSDKECCTFSNKTAA